MLPVTVALPWKQPPFSSRWALTAPDRVHLLTHLRIPADQSVKELALLHVWRLEDEFDARADGIQPPYSRILYHVRSLVLDPLDVFEKLKLDANRFVELALPLLFCWRHGCAPRRVVFRRHRVDRRFFILKRRRECIEPVPGSGRNYRRVSMHLRSCHHNRKSDP